MKKNQYIAPSVEVVQVACSTCLLNVSGDPALTNQGNTSSSGSTMYGD